MSARFSLWLLAAALATIWQLPQGRLLLYPFTLFATLAHELGHGLAALALGAQFEALRLNADASGLALWRGNVSDGGRALIAAAGLLGPSLAALLLFALARHPRLARLALAMGALLLVLITALWVRNGFGIAFTLACAASAAALARWLPPLGAQLALRWVALTLCLSWLVDLDYLFSPGALVDGRRLPSDSAQIADALGWHYSVWGALVAMVSLAIVFFALRTASPGADQRR